MYLPDCTCVTIYMYEQDCLTVGWINSACLMIKSIKMSDNYNNMIKYVAVCVYLCVCIYVYEYVNT